MGKQRTTLLKRVAKKIVEQHGDKLEPDFEKVKKFLDQFGLFKSKTDRNVVSGIIISYLKVNR